jgi:peroxiredoxin
MAIKAGDRLPAGTLWEFIDEETPGCSVGPNSFQVENLVKGKRIAILGLPGAFTPTCSAKHLPGFVQQIDKLRAAKVDEVWCVSVNDAFVMGAWGREQGAKGKVRMMADGSAAYTKALGLDQDLNARGLGVRSQRYSMLVDDGVVKVLNIEEPGKFEISGAEKLLEQAQKLGR